MEYRVLIIGERCLDKFVYGDCLRLNPEAPTVIFSPKYETANLGMAANVAANMEAFNVGVEVTLISNEDMPIKTRFIDDKSNQMLLRMDENDRVYLKADLRGIVWDRFDCVVVSDYSKGFLSIQDLIHISESHKLTFLDTKKPIGIWAEKFTFVKVNEHEYNNRLCDLENTIVTKGEKGASYMGRDYLTEKVEVPNIIGAGDTFLAALVVSYIKYKNIEKSINYANESAHIIVQKKGVSTI